MGKRKFRNYLINPSLQVRIALQCAIAAIFIALLSGGIAFFSVWSVMTEFAPDGLIAYHRTILLTGIILGILGIACVIAILSLIVTHRIAGPIYNIEQHVKSALNGEPVTNIQLRKGDEFHELADLINQVIEKIPPQENL